MDFDTYERELWAGRASAYERGFARLTAHAAGPLLDAAGVGPDTRVLGIARAAIDAAGVSWPQDIPLAPFRPHQSPAAFAALLAEAGFASGQAP